MNIGTLIEHPNQPHTTPPNNSAAKTEGMPQAKTPEGLIVEQVQSSHAIQSIVDAIKNAQSFDSFNDDKDEKEEYLESLETLLKSIPDDSSRDGILIGIVQNAKLEYEDRLRMAQLIKTAAIKKDAILAIAQDPDVWIGDRKRMARACKDQNIKDEILLAIAQDSKLNGIDRLQVARPIINTSIRDQALIAILHTARKGENYLKVAQAINDTNIRNQFLLAIAKDPDMRSYHLQAVQAINDTNIRNQSLLAIAKDPNMGFYHLEAAQAICDDAVTRDEALLAIINDASADIIERLQAAEGIENTSLRDDSLLSLTQDQDIADALRVKILSSIKNECLKSIFLTPSGYPRYQDDLNKNWLDLRPSECYFGELDLGAIKGTASESLARKLNVLPDNEQYACLKNCINTYHNLPKTEEQRLPKRIESLKTIAKEAASYIQTSAKPLQSSEIRNLQEIIARANLKAAYLTQLISLEEEAIRRVNRLPNNSQNLSAFKVIPSIKNYLLDLDPAKRINTEELYKKWQSTPSTSCDDSHRNFWLWLEVQDTHCLHADLRHSFIKRGLKKVIFKDGLAYNELFRSFDHQSNGLVKNGEYLYNIGQDGNLYISPTEEKKMQFSVLIKPPLKSRKAVAALKKIPLNHDTILAGENILCAGRIFFKNGKIVLIDTDSGHYLPRMIDNLKPALSYLLEKNPNAIGDATLIMEYRGANSGFQEPYSVFKNLESVPGEALNSTPKITLEGLGFKTGK